MYRIWCSYEPNFKKAAGGTGKGPKQGRGAWTVLNSDVSIAKKAVRYVGGLGAVGILSPSPRRPGTRVSPRKLLAEFHEWRARNA